MTLEQTKQKETLSAFNGINSKLDDLSSTLGAIADLCVFYGEYDNLDDESRRADAFNRIRRVAEKEQRETQDLITSVERCSSIISNDDVEI